MQKLATGITQFKPTKLHLPILPVNDNCLWNKLREAHVAKGDPNGWRRDYERKMEKHRIGFKYWVRRLQKIIRMRSDFQGFANLYESGVKEDSVRVGVYGTHWVIPTSRTKIISKRSIHLKGRFN